MRMKRKAAKIMAFLLIAALSLSACNGTGKGGKKAGGESSGMTAESAGDPSYGLSDDMKKLLEEIKSETSEESGWQDNTLDAWMATTNQKLSFKGMEDMELWGKWADDCFMTPDGVNVFMSRSSKNKNDQILYLMERIKCDRDGKTEDVIFAKGDNLSKPRVLAYGIVSGTQELWGNVLSNAEEISGTPAGQNNEEESATRIFLQLNEYSTIKKDGKMVAVRFLGKDCDSENVEQFMLDKTGRIYLLTVKYNYTQMDGYKVLTGDPENYFYVASPDGNLLCERKLVKETKDTADPMFVTFPDGEVGISFFDGAGSDRKLTLFQYEEDASDLKKVASLDKSYLTNYAITLSDAGKLISVDSGGVWESDPQGGDRTQLYTWKEHGMRLRSVYAISATKQDIIDILYEDAEGMHYISLKPVDRQQVITEMVMAVSSATEERCREAAMRFNQKYPNYHLTLNAGYDNARLNSELISGNGPVLIDTNLTGFEQLAKYWEPLDGVLDAMGLLEELEPKALEAGKIGSATYGIITDFYFETLITLDPETKDWDYDKFLKYLQDHSERPYIYMDYDANCGSLFVYRFWQHGLEDGVLLNGSQKESYVDTQRFRAILELAKNKCQNQGKLDDKDARTRLYDGETSFMLAWFFKPSDIALFRMAFGDDAYTVGEPMQEGAAHILRCSDPITIRHSATLEEKKGALLFIRELLSYESQMAASKELNFKFSVRKDVLKECITNLEPESTLESNPYLGVQNLVKLGDKADPEKDYQKLRELLENSVPLVNLPKELSNILWEELDPYFEGKIYQSKMIKQLNNRIRLYLQEQ